MPKAAQQSWRRPAPSGGAGAAAIRPPSRPPARWRSQVRQMAGARGRDLYYANVEAGGTGRTGGDRTVNADSGAAGGRRPNGALEAEVLAVLQGAAGPLTAAQVLKALGGGLAYTTVVTTLSRLHEKQILSRIPSGRAFAYAPVTDASGLTARRMHQVLAGGPDREQVLTRFVSDLAADDAALLRDLLETCVEREPDRPTREE